jgi:phosphoribulokinase
MIVFGIAGASGVGKSWLAERLQGRLQDRTRVVTINADGYHKYDRNRRVSLGLVPEELIANRIDALSEDLLALRSGSSVIISTWDHFNGAPGPPKRVDPPEVLILEGLHSCLSVFEDRLDLRCYLDGSMEEISKWRMSRDMERRNYNPDWARAENEMRRVMTERHILPQKSVSDIVVAVSLVADEREFLIERMPGAGQEAGAPMSGQAVAVRLANAILDWKEGRARNGERP